MKEVSKEQYLTFIYNFPGETVHRGKTVYHGETLVAYINSNHYYINAN